MIAYKFFVLSVVCTFAWSKIEIITHKDNEFRWSGHRNFKRSENQHFDLHTKNWIKAIEWDEDILRIAITTNKKLSKYDLSDCRFSNWGEKIVFI